MFSITLVSFSIICLSAFNQQSQHFMIVLAQNCKLGIFSRMSRILIFNFNLSYGTHLAQMNYGVEVVDLGFKFRYFDNDYTQVSISFNGYVCLGDNSRCSENKSPSPHDILIGLNYVVDPTSVANGQIYYKRLDSNSLLSEQ